MQTTGSILLLGNVSQHDVDVCTSVAAEYGFHIQAFITPAEFAAQPHLSLPSGCLSFLSCNAETLSAAFNELPAGFGVEIPWFQAIDKSKPVTFLARLPVHGIFTTPIDAVSAQNAFLAIIRNDMVAHRNNEMVAEIIKYRRQKQQLIKIGMSLSLQNDLDKLLSSILFESRDIVGADAGSIYIRQKVTPGGAFTNAIRFKVSQNDSIELGNKFDEFDLAIDETTVAGYVAVSGKLLNIEDVDAIGESVPYKKPRMKYEQQFEYPVKTMLTVPLKNMAGDVVGILQLMNKKSDVHIKLHSHDDAKRLVSVFSASDEDFILSIASQAAVSIERVMLYDEIQGIFEGYLRSSIAAIDERDRVTYGHSRRVMGYALAFADAVNKQPDGSFTNERFDENRKNQFRFAALLHDIGKIGVPEALLTKETRLTKDEMTAVFMRGEYVKTLLRSRAVVQPVGWESEAALDVDLAFVEKTNRSGYLDVIGQEAIRAISIKQYPDTCGVMHAFLNDHEIECLSIVAGNLTKKERERINSHAQATRRLLSRIPWTKGLERIPEIACHHHERLDGTGYPDGFCRDEICFESRALAVIDIYEALIAQDRPYKPKIAPEKALEILRAEAKANHLDGNIVEFFIASGLYKTFLDEQKPEDDYSR